MDTNLPPCVGGAAHGAQTYEEAITLGDPALTFTPPPITPNPPHYSDVVKDRNHLRRTIPAAISLLTRLERILTNLNGVYTLEIPAVPGPLNHWQIDVASEISEISTLLALLGRPGA